MNKHYVIHDAQGNILRTVFCPESDASLQVLSTELMIEGEANPMTDTVNPVTRKVVKNSRTVTPVIPPAPKPRLSAERQLELLWEAMDAGQFPKAEPFYSAVKAARSA